MQCVDSDVYAHRRAKEGNHEAMSGCEDNFDSF